MVTSNIITKLIVNCVGVVQKAMHMASKSSYWVQLSCTPHFSNFYQTDFHFPGYFICADEQTNKETKKQRNKETKKQRNRETEKQTEIY